MFKARPLLVTLAALAILFLVLAYFAGLFHVKVQQMKAPTLDVAGELVSARLQDIQSSVVIPGTVSPTDEAIIGSRLLAAINQVHVSAGDHIRRGEMLVEFDASSLRAVVEQREQSVSSLQASLEESNRNRERAERLFESGNLSRADLDRTLTGHRIAEAEFQRAKQAAEEARAQLGHARIVAPLSGTVQEVYVDIGDTAVPGQALMKVFNPGRVRIEAVLPERLIEHVSPGSELPARIDALDVSVSSFVEEIVPSADPGSRTFRIKALLPSVPGLYPGMFARLEIPVGLVTRIVVPAGAVRKSGQLEFVYLSVDGVTLRRTVRSSERNGNAVVIASGLQAGDLVIVPTVD